MLLLNVSSAHPGTGPVPGHLLSAVAIIQVKQLLLAAFINASLMMVIWRPVATSLCKVWRWEWGAMLSHNLLAQLVGGVIM